MNSFIFASIRNIFYFLVIFSSLVWAQTPTAELDRQIINEGETVTLTISVPRTNSAVEPDLTPLEKDFDILGHSQSTQVQIINGNTTATTAWQITLSPKRSGDLVVPPVTVDGEQTSALVLQVKTASNAPQTSGEQPIFLEAEIEPREGYIQSQFTYTVRLFYRQEFQSGALSEPSLTDAHLQKLGEDAKYQTQRGGHSYRVIERRYAIFPEHSGKTEISPLIFEGEAAGGQRSRADPFFDRFFNDPFFTNPFNTQHLRLRSPSAEITVKPQAAQFQGKWWLPARDLKLSETWQPEIARVGEPLTRTLILEAKGLTAAQLPDLPLSDITGLKAYPDQPQNQDRQDGQWLIGERQQKIAFVPNQAGEYTLPEIRLPWWDIKQDVLRYAVLPARTIQVLPAANAEDKVQKTEDREQIPSSASSSSLPSSEVAPATLNLWQLLSAALALGWLLTVFGWWVSRRQRVSQPPPTAPVESASLKAAKQSFKQACFNNDPRQARQALLIWIRASDGKKRSLSDFAAQLVDPAARAAIEQLDQALYAPSTEPWSGQACWQALTKTLSTRTASPVNLRSPLPRLYPQTLTTPFSTD